MLTKKKLTLGMGTLGVVALVGFGIYKSSYFEKNLEFSILPQLIEKGPHQEALKLIKQIEEKKDKIPVDQRVLIILYRLKLKLKEIHVNSPNAISVLDQLKGIKKELNLAKLYVGGLAANPNYTSVSTEYLAIENQINTMEIEAQKSATRNLNMMSQQFNKMINSQAVKK